MLSKKGIYLPLFLQINRFAVPLMLTGILQLLYNSADAVIVGRYAGSNSLAAVGSTTSIVFLLVTMFTGIAIGANYLAARCHGAGDQEGMFQTVHCAAFLSLILGVAAAAVGLVCSTPLLRWAGTPAQVLPLSALYLRIYFLAMPALVVYNFGSALLRAVGQTRYPLVVMVFSGVLNVALNLFFVIRCNMGVAGVAIATLISELFSAVMVTYRLCQGKDGCRLELRRIRFYRDKASVMLRVGLSAGLQGIIFSAANVMIQAVVNSFGAAAMAGSAAASSLESFIHTAQNAYYQAAITLTSQSMGAKKPWRVFQIFRVCLCSTTVLGVSLCGLLMLFQTQLLGIYVKPSDAAYEAVLLAGTARIFTISRFQFLGGLMECACGTLRGLGKNISPTVTTLLGACGVRVLWVYTVFASYGTLESLYLVYPASWLLTFLTHCVFLFLWHRSFRAEKEGERLVPSI